MNEKKGKIHSIQTLGTLDGPGVRFVVFFQGCNLRCGCCHNPDTWNLKEGNLVSAYEIVDKAERYKTYFGNEGGITLSGGEPLLQSEFAKEIFVLCKQKNISTCLDTSGSVFSESVRNLLKFTDRVLLDIKYHTNELYQKFVGCNIDLPLSFLNYLNEQNIPVTLRQVIIPTLNDNDENVEFLNYLISKFKCIDKVELLPFKKICQSKYQALGIDFAFEKYDVPSVELVNGLQTKIKSCKKCNMSKK